MQKEARELVRFTHENEWVKINRNKAVVGLNNFNEDDCGNFLFVNFVFKENDFLEKDEIGGDVKFENFTYDFNIPLTGEILEVNKDKGTQQNWLFKMNIEYPLEIEDLFSENEYKKISSYE